MSSQRSSSEETVSRLAEMVRDETDVRSGITNDLIEDFCYRMCAEEEQNLFAGVYPRDEIPIERLARRKYFNVIINLASRRRGELNGHFVCVCATPETCVYIDPFGLPNLMTDVAYFLRRCNRHIYHNRKQIQTLDSPFCGMFVSLYTVYFNDPRVNARRLKLRFENRPTKRNDQLCMFYLKELIDEIYENQM